METHLANAIEITNDSARYDASVKELLADKQVLARILKYSLEELLKKDHVETKKRKLSDEYGLIMDEELEGRVGAMCNFSEVILERGREEGRTHGVNKMQQLIGMLIHDGREELLHKIAIDSELCESLLKEYQL